MMIFSIIAELFLLLFLLAKDKNDGEKNLFRSQHWRATDVILVLVLFQGSPVLLVLLVYILQKVGINSLSRIDTLPSAAMIFYVMVLSFALLCPILIFRSGRNLTVLGLSRRKLGRNVTLGAIIGLAAFVIFDGLHIILTKHFATRVIQLITTSKTTKDYFFLFGGTVILGPILEEVVYRGILYSPFRRKYGPVKAIIISSLFFTLAHFLNPIDFLYGIVFTTLYEKTESIISTFVAHSVGNLLLLASAFYYLR